MFVVFIVVVVAALAHALPPLKIIKSFADLFAVQIQVVDGEIVDEGNIGIEVEKGHGRRDRVFGRKGSSAVAAATRHRHGHVRETLVHTFISGDVSDVDDIRRFPLELIFEEA